MICIPLHYPDSDFFKFSFNFLRIWLIFFMPISYETRRFQKNLDEILSGFHEIPYIVVKCSYDLQILTN